MALCHLEYYNMCAKLTFRPEDAVEYEWNGFLLWGTWMCFHAISMSCVEVKR